jgi:hypothetical protein
MWFMVAPHFTVALFVEKLACVYPMYVVLQ